MNKQQIIESIRKVNQSANLEFLMGFGERELETYLLRLQTLLGQRGTGWVREGDTRAVVTNGGRMRMSDL